MDNLCLFGRGQLPEFNLCPELPTECSCQKTQLLCRSPQLVRLSRCRFKPKMQPNVLLFTFGTTYGTCINESHFGRPIVTIVMILMILAVRREPSGPPFAKQFHWRRLGRKLESATRQQIGSLGLPWSRNVNMDKEYWMYIGDYLQGDLERI